MKLLVKLFTKTVKGRYRVRWKSFGSLRVHDKNYWKYRSIDILGNYEKLHKA